MPSKPKKPCAYPRCPELTTQRYCDTHNKNATRYYDRVQRDTRSTTFYNSTAWQTVRRQALLRDNNLCQQCFKEGILKPADMVHHKVEVKDNWELRLDIDNLVSLCNACHNKVHGKRG